MKPSLASLISILILPSIVFAADPVLLKNVSGTVELKAGEQAAWTQALPGASVPSGSQVRTGADGRAELKFKNKTSVWLKPSTNVALEQQGAKHNRIILANGSMKLRVPHLGFREKFEVRTPVAVASVRGTVFTVDDRNLQTLFGDVKMAFDDGRKLDVPQGTGFNGEKVSLLSRIEEEIGLENWAPGIADDQRRRELQEFVNNRQQIRDFAHDALARNNEVIASLAAAVKQNDFAAGRTLTDVHGNLVRVEQVLDRPNPSTIQVTNVTLRTSYNFTSGRYSYHGTPDSRIDALIGKAVFNENLPTQISDFPGFFSSNKDSVKIDYADLIAVNMSDPNHIATVAFLGERGNLDPRNLGYTDDIVSNLYVGNLNGREELSTLSKANAVSFGLTGYQENKLAKSNYGNGSNGQLYSFAEKPFTKLPNTQTWTNGPGDSNIWVCTENYVINNSGGIRNVSDYTSSGINVSDLLGNSAAESVVFVKGEKRIGNGLAPDNANDILGTNIDLVIIPDLFYAVAKTLATSADVFNTTH